MAELEQQMWIGVDLDGTLARYTGWRGKNHIGRVIPRMANRVRRWHNAGKRVKIFTARADDERNVNAIKKWLKANRLPNLEVTNLKDRYMTRLWDDRAVSVERNTGVSFTDGRVAESVVETLLGEDVEIVDGEVREFGSSRPYWVSPHGEIIRVPNHASWARTNVVTASESLVDSGTKGKDSGVFTTMRSLGWVRAMREHDHLFVNPAFCTQTQLREIKGFASENRLVITDEATHRDIFNPRNGD